MCLLSLAQLVNLLDIHLTAFGVQVLPIMTTGRSQHISRVSHLEQKLSQAFPEKLIYLMFSASMAVPWGLATLGVLFGSKLLLVPIQVLKYLWAISQIIPSKCHTCDQWCRRSARSAPPMWQSVLHLHKVGRTISGEEWFLSILHVAKNYRVPWTGAVCFSQSWKPSHLHSSTS